MGWDGSSEPVWTDSLPLFQTGAPILYTNFTLMYWKVNFGKSGDVSLVWNTAKISVSYTQSQVGAQFPLKALTFFSLFFCSLFPPCPPSEWMKVSIILHSKLLCFLYTYVNTFIIFPWVTTPESAFLKCAHRKMHPSCSFSGLPAFLLPFHLLPLVP